MMETIKETIYIDPDHHCHRTDDGTMTAVETDFFIGKCDAYVEGYCYDTSKGYVQIYPWKDISFLETTQKLYEEMTASAIKEERIVALEEANATLQEENEMLTACVLEMSEIVYA